MKKQYVTRAAALVLTAALILSGSASALFGRKAEPEKADPKAPVVQPLEIKTYRNVPVQGVFAGEGEGDLTFALAEMPKKGVVVIEGGGFTYAPEEGVTGGDRFTYTASDSAGRISQPAEVKVEIVKTKSGVRYGDTAGSPAAAAAQELAEAGIFTGAKIGENYYFEPDRPVSRTEFLAMVMETAGCEAPAVTMTGFCDDASIPTWAKAYAAAGVAEGIVQGCAAEGGPAFRGEEAITFSQAATVLDRVLDMGNVDLDVWYADREAVPSWASQAVGNMEALNVLAAGSFGSATMEAPVTRADAALMLSAARTLLEGEEKPAGLFGWLK